MAASHLLISPLSRTSLPLSLLNNHEKDQKINFSKKKKKKKELNLKKLFKPLKKQNKQYGPLIRFYTPFLAYLTSWCRLINRLQMYTKDPLCAPLTEN